MYKDGKLMKHGDGYIVFSNDEQVIKSSLNINDDLKFSHGFKEFEFAIWCNLVQ